MLNALKRPTSHWDDLLIYILSSKLDNITLREWQSNLTGSELPTLKQFIDFLFEQCQMLEATVNPVSVYTKNNNKNNHKRSQSDSKRQYSGIATVKAKCNYCQGEHSIYYCKGFLALPTTQRMSEIRSRKICFNCLRSTNHSANKCSSGNCKVCKLKHNTLLHVDSNVSESSKRDINTDEESSSAETKAAMVTHASSSLGAKCTLLSTAIVYAYDRSGSRRPCRVLLDNGSQVNFISRRFLDILGLKPHSLEVLISGVNDTTSSANQAVSVKLQSRLNSYSATINCLVAD